MFARIREFAKVMQGFARCAVQGKMVPNVHVRFTGGMAPRSRHRFALSPYQISSWTVFSLSPCRPSATTRRDMADGARSRSREAELRVGSTSNTRQIHTMRRQI